VLRQKRKGEFVIKPDYISQERQYGIQIQFSGRETDQLNETEEKGPNGAFMTSQWRCTEAIGGTQRPRQKRRSSGNGCWN